MTCNSLNLPVSVGICSTLLVAAVFWPVTCLLCECDFFLSSCSAHDHTASGVVCQICSMVLYSGQPWACGSLLSLPVLVPVVGSSGSLLSVLVVVPVVGSSGSLLSLSVLVIVPVVGSSVALLSLSLLVPVVGSSGTLRSLSVLVCGGQPWDPLVIVSVSM